MFLNAILGNSGTCRNIVEALLRQNSKHIVGEKGKDWGIVELGIVEA